MNDPFRLLGLDPDASLDEVRAARRRLAKALHPDRPGGGDARAMGEVNRAFEHVVRAIRARPDGARDGAGAPTTGDGPPPPGAARPGPAPAPVPRERTAPVRRSRYVEHDTPSFSLDVLPAEAFEALLVVTTWLGELLVDEPPYALEAVLDEPTRCWCRLDLVPEAGASMVSVGVAALDGAPWPPPSAEAVRDRWVEALNRLGG